jgi:hypothetical protein
MPRHLAGHLAGHLAMGSLSPEPDCREPTSPTPAQQAAAVCIAHWACMGCAACWGCSSWFVLLELGMSCQGAVSFACHM